MAGLDSSSSTASASRSSVPKTGMQALERQTQLQASSPKLSSFFTQSQFALALVIQKSKPEGLSTKDYCLQLQARIRSGLGIPVDTHRYVDTPDFWKDQYHTLYLEKKALEGKVLQLEEAQHTWAELDNSCVSLDERSRKRPALSEEVEGRLEGQEEDAIPVDQDIALRLSGYNLRMARQRGNLEHIAKDSNIPDHLEDLSRATIQVLAVLDNTLSDCSIPLWSLRCDADQKVAFLLQQVMSQIALSFLSCFNALDELCRTILGRKKMLDIVYRLVTFFSKALDHLRTICSIQAENEVAERRRLRSKRSKVDDEYAVNKYLTRTLVSITQIDWKIEHPGHSDILEGILFSIMEQTGRLVSGAIFKEHVASSDFIGNITKNETLLLPEAAKLETRYIIPILRGGMGTTSARRDLIARILAGSSLNATLQTGSKRQANDLLAKARKKIQSSLVKSAVGGHELEGLRPAKPPEQDIDYSPLTMPHVERYGSEWLLEAVWALVGWDLAV